MNNRTLVYIVGEFPSRTETFIWEEILYMNRRAKLYIVALKRGEIIQDSQIISNDLESRVIYLPSIFSISIWKAFIKGLLHEGWKYICKVGKEQKKEGNFFRCLKNLLWSWYLKDLFHTCEVEHIHAHFAGFPTSVAMQLAVLIKVPFSFTAHAHDIYVEQDRLTRKIASASFVVTCTGYNEKYLRKLTSFPEKIHLVYHGVDLARWKYRPPFSIQLKTMHILLIGRLVEKKGIIYLLKALMKLKGCLPFECIIVGCGEEFRTLYAFCKENNLTDEVIFIGWQSPDEIASRMKNADVFVLPSIIASNLDRDGLPNVLLEAMACGVPIVSTEISAIPELIKHNENGLLVPEKRADKLAEALSYLYWNDSLRACLAVKGRQTVEEKFDRKICHQMFGELFT